MHIFTLNTNLKLTFCIRDVRLGCCGRYELTAPVTAPPLRLGCNAAAADKVAGGAKVNGGATAPPLNASEEPSHVSSRPKTAVFITSQRNKYKRCPPEWVGPCATNSHTKSPTTTTTTNSNCLANLLNSNSEWNNNESAYAHKLLD